MQEKKIVSIEDRIPKLKEARKKKANRRLTFYLTLFFILILIIIYLQSPLSHVKHIVVKGNQLINSEIIVTKSQISTNDNIWSLDFEKIQGNVEQLPEIKSATIKRVLPNTVEIRVVEFVRVGYVKKNGSFLPVLENGQALTNRPIEAPMGDAPILIGWDNSTYLSEMTQELRNLHSSITGLISEIHWIPDEANPYKLRLYMNDNREVITSIRNFSKKMRAYPSIASQISPDREGYINLDLGAFFVPYNNQDTTTNESQGETVHEGER